MAKQRIKVTLNPDALDLVGELAELTGRPLAAVVADVVESAAPSLERVAASLRKARDEREAAATDLRVAFERGLVAVEDAIAERLRATADLDDPGGPLDGPEWDDEPWMTEVRA